VRRSERTASVISHQINLPLVIGLILVMALVLIAAFGGFLAPFDPLEVHYIVQDGSGEFHTPPFEPGELGDFPLGSDVEGRDVLSRLLVGVRPTLVLVILIVATRLVVGTILGLLEGWYGGLVGDMIGSATKIALSVPMLVIAIMVIYLFGPQFQAGVFIVALSVVGWAQTARVVANRVRQVRGEAYIEAARALGAGDARILWAHIVPQVRSLLLITLSFEMSAVLLQMAELGFLGFFMGGGAIMLIPDDTTPAFIPERIAGAPELGQMLAGAWQNFIYTPTLPVIVGTMFFLAVFSFMMLGEGLKSYYAEPTSPSPLSILRSSSLTGPLLDRLDTRRVKSAAPYSRWVAS
jgi:ABC-type dipeptide/oligopeptide/nickel transport system permease subunit